MPPQLGDDAEPPQGGGPTVRRMVLGAQLRRLREAAGITRAQAGYAIRGSESKMSRLELGRVGFKKRDVADLLTLYGVHDEKDREQLLAMAAEANKPGWWHRYNDLLPSWFTDYVGLEESASRIQTLEMQFVPGLLQTEEYARVIACHGRKEWINEEVERRIALRMQRQRILSRPNPPKVWAFLDESVLHRPIGGPKVLKKQLEVLLEWTSQPHVTVQILPYERSGHAAECAFTMLRFAEAELPDVVYIEHLTGALYLDKPEEREPYSRAIDRLAVDCETPAASRAMIEKAFAAL